MSRTVDLLVDGCGLIGAVLVVVGAFLIYVPAGFIAAGGFFLAGAWLFARHGG